MISGRVRKVFDEESKIVSFSVSWPKNSLVEARLRNTKRMFERLRDNLNRVNYALKSIFLCAPSQKGLFSEAPHLQKAVVLSLCSTFPEE